MVFNVPIVSKLIFWPFEFLANSIYKRADAICAVSNTYCKRAKDVNHKVKDTTSVFIGTELDVFDRYASENQVMRKDDGEIWMAYCGTLGTSYNLPLVFEAMKKIHNPLLRFIVMGDGPLMEQFKSKAKGLNVTFTGRLDYSHMCGMLSACDIVVNPIVGRSVATIINKHADYAACGKPVLNTQKSEEYQILVEKYRMGFNCITSDDV
ncbi:MAG: glycosyltransferase, partial [Clostridia bacterium]|nr:glycosyltransferase [Clostridia bacterium]